MKWDVFSRITQPKNTMIGMPWTLSGAFLAFYLASSGSVAISIWFWMVIAFATARIAGMSLNQLIDRHIDAANLRTKNRALPTNQTTPLEVAIVAICSLLLFGFSCLQINFLCFQLSLLASLLLWAYSYVKRLSWGCHIVLGCVQFFGPVMAWAAIQGSLSLPPIFIGIAACCSIAASDIIYGMQDYEFERKNGIHSAPVRFGIKKGYLVARGFHALTLASLCGVGVMLQLSGIFYTGIVLVGIMYVGIYTQLQKKSMSIMDAFFKSNVYAGLIVLAFTLGEVTWGKLL